LLHCISGITTDQDLLFKTIYDIHDMSFVVLVFSALLVMISLSQCFIDPSALGPSDLWGFSLDHILEPWDWIPKRQSSIQHISGWNAKQAWDAFVPCPRPGGATRREHPSGIKAPYTQRVGDKGGILQRQLSVDIREHSGPESMNSQ
jgi:hypothetical protein